MDWFELNQKERVVNFFNKHTIKEFWTWWSRGVNSTMEVRIRDYKHIKNVAYKFGLPYSISGVYVSSASELLKVLGATRKLHTMWFGINPKRRAINKYNKKTYGGKDINVDCIRFIFIDVDRNNTKELATTKELEDVNSFVGLLIEDFNKIGLTDYIKIFSGNGIQLLYRLDEDIYLPQQVYSDNVEAYIESPDLQKYKSLIKQVLGSKLINKYNTKKNKELYNCGIDPSGFNIGRVGAISGSFNFKHETPILRGILGYGEGNNEGLSESLTNELDNLKLPKFNSKYRKKELDSTFRYTAKTIKNSKLAQFMLQKNLPAGMRNNWLLFSFKCLIKDNGIDINSPELKKFTSELDVCWGRTNVYNLAGDSFHFNPNAVNNYCVLNNIPLLYPALFDRVIVRKFMKHVFEWNNFKACYNALGKDMTVIKFKENNSIVQDINEMTNALTHEDDKDSYFLVQKIYGMVIGLLNKYEESKVKYVFENYLPEYLVKQAFIKKFK